MSPSSLIPRRVLFGVQTRVEPTISPDGTRIAYVAPVDGVPNVWVGRRGRGDFSPITRDRGHGILAYAWAPDGRHVLLLQDRDGREHPHLHVVDVSGGDVRDLTPFDGVRARLVAAVRRVPGQVLVGLNRRDPTLHDVYRADLSTGELVLVAENPGFVRWLADRDLRVRGAVAWTPDGGARILVRDDDEARWRPVHEVGHEDSVTTRPLGFTADGRHLLVLSSLDAGAARLLCLDLDGGGCTVLFEDPRHDVVGVSLHPETGLPQLAVVRRQRTHLEVLDPSLATDVDRLLALGDGDVQVVGRDDRDRVWLLRVTADDRLPVHHLYDRGTGRAELLFTEGQELDRYPLARMEPFSFAARDGLTIEGYLSFPPDAGRSALPAVLVVHGGPWTRDIWGFRAETQWLANRGYLCIQVNFRGSTGYGKDFVNAGDREWGGRMQDDLVDAVGWTIERGYADPRRIAIYGISYGGYAALVGATFTPDLFRCAVAAAAPSNLVTFIESIPAAWRPMVSRLHTRIGNPHTEPDFLWSRSPLSRVDRIRIPVLIAQGANDPRVPRSESEQIVAAMRDRDIAHEYLLFPDEGHWLVKPDNRVAFYAAVERFLAEHLGGRCEA